MDLSHSSAADTRELLDQDMLYLVSSNPADSGRAGKSRMWLRRVKKLVSPPSLSAPHMRRACATERLDLPWRQEIGVRLWQVGRAISV